MKNGTLFWGTLLVAIGITILFFRYTGVAVDISNLFPYWSVLLILLGTAFIVKQKLAKNILISVVALISGFAIVASTHEGNECYWDGSSIKMGKYKIDTDNDEIEFRESDEKDEENRVYSNDSLSNIQPQPNPDSTSGTTPQNPEGKNKKKEVVY
jgi:hypothetical protein